MQLVKISHSEFLLRVIRKEFKGPNAYTYIITGRHRLAESMSPLSAFSWVVYIFVLADLLHVNLNMYFLRIGISAMCPGADGI